MVREDFMASAHENLNFRLVGVIPSFVPFTRSYDVANKEIRVVAGDRGGWNALEPPLTHALDEGCTVRVYFTATCGQQFISGKLVPDKRMDVQTGSPEWDDLDKFFSPSEHHLTVVGASQSEEGITAASHALIMSRSASRLGVQDMYGSSIPILRLMDNALERLCVTDEFARSMVLQEFPRLADRVVVTGGPQFDKTIEVKKNWQERRRVLREALNVDNDQAVFLIAGGLNGTAEILALLEGGITKVNRVDQSKVILRAHPRATDADKQLVQRYLDSTRYRWFTDVDRSLAPTSDDLLPGVDFVLSGYSTTNYFGILYEMPGVVYVGTPAFKRDLKAEKGLDRPPEVEIGAGWYVQNADDMANVISAVRFGAARVPDLAVDNLFKIVAAQKAIASFNDGRAAERVWHEMQELMSK